MDRVNRRIALTNLAAVPLAAHWGAGPAVAQAAPTYTITELGTLPGFPSTNARAINASGQVVGSISNPHSPSKTGSSHAFLWEQGVLTDLGTLGGIGSEANAINDAGQVVGWTEVTGLAHPRPFLWERGVMTDLGTLPGHQFMSGQLGQRGRHRPGGGTRGGPR